MDITGNTASSTAYIEYTASAGDSIFDTAEEIEIWDIKKNIPDRKGLEPVGFATYEEHRDLDNRGSRTELR